MSRPHLALCLEYSIFAHGGTEVLVAELIRQLASEYAVTLVSHDDGLAGTWVEPLVARHIAWRPEDRGPEAVQRLIAALQAGGVELVHFHLGGNYAWGVRRPSHCPIVLAGRAGLRCLTTNHGFFSGLDGYCAHYRPFWMKLALLPAAWIAKLIQLAHVGTEVAVSQHDYRSLRRWYAPMRARFRQIYHSKLPVVPPTPPAQKEKTVVCVGTIGPRKGQTFLTEAFAQIARRHPAWRLVLAGRPSDDEMMRAIRHAIDTHHLSERVSLQAGLDDAAITQLLATAEIFVMPSLFEGLGLSLQEALFHGCACVATRCGGPEDLIDDGVNGLLVPRADVSSLAQALDRLMSDEELRVRFQSEGPLSIRRRKMSATEMADAYRTLYAESGLTAGQPISAPATRTP